MNGSSLKTPFIFLAGGKGTRLQAIQPHRPKPMVEVRGKPFLHWLVDHYFKLGYRNFIFSIGHKAEVVESYPWDQAFKGARFRFIAENAPLGTGGAVLEVFSRVQDLDDAWVINGDTLLPAPLPWVGSDFEAFYTVLDGSEVFDAKPNLHTKDRYVVNEEPGGQYFDGGALYVTRRALNQFVGSIPCSIHEVLKPSMSLNKVGYGLVSGTCYDIGTPDRLKRFEDYLDATAQKN